MGWCSQSAEVISGSGAPLLGLPSPCVSCLQALQLPSTVPRRVSASGNWKSLISECKSPLWPQRRSSGICQHVMQILKCCEYSRVDRETGRQEVQRMDATLPSEPSRAESCTPAQRTEWHSLNAGYQQCSGRPELHCYNRTHACPTTLVRVLNLSSRDDSLTASQRTHAVWGNIFHS